MNMGMIFSVFKKVNWRTKMTSYEINWNDLTEEATKDFVPFDEEE